jgi:iron complex transport system substrate-binding protein
MGINKKEMIDMKANILVGITMGLLLLTLPAAASDYTLGVYGNANEDDTINMQDVTYTELIILEYRDATELADAKYDGDIDIMDMTQIALIILGREKELTLLDMADRTVTVPRPIERVVCTASNIVRLVIALDECDKLVGTDRYSHPDNGRMDPLCFNSPVCAEQLCGGGLNELPDTGCSVGPGGHEIHLQEELIMSLEADVIFITSDLYADSIQEKTGIPVVYVISNGYRFGDVCKATEIVGMVLKKEEEAEELSSFITNEVNNVAEITSSIPDSDKPRVFWGWTQCSFESTVGSNSMTLDRAGAINVAYEMPDGWGSVTKEQIIAWDPDIILVGASSRGNEASVMRLQGVLNDPDYQDITAVKNGDVYLVPLVHIAGSPQDMNLFNLIYLAKLLHPEEFEDLDVEEEGNEIFKRFLRVDGLFTEYVTCNADWLREWLDEQ